MKYLYIIYYTLFTTFTAHVSAHSWIHCVDYDPTASLLVGNIQNSRCRSFPRGVPNTALFGEDRGFNYQPVRNVACRNSYSGSFSTFSKGSTIRMLWPAKNHIAARCTNPYINDQSLRLYLYPVSSLSQPDPSFSTWTSSQYLFYDFKRDGQGFQNCPDACPVVDRLPCYGDVRFPNALPTGLYKAIWVWIFNPNERYTHCFDFQLTDSTPLTKAPTTRVPTTRAPTTRTPTTRVPTTRAPTTRTPTTRAPTTRAPTTRTPTTRTPTTRAPTTRTPTTRVPTTCASLYQQCGGNGWTGTTCCQTGSRCQVQNAYYSQCVPL